jgi:cellulose synthase/poly-beta-1,6-N-acetylglucosamine synthase-like glycosyltransferase
LNAVGGKGSIRSRLLRALEVVFWVLVGCPIYSMIGYPLLMMVASRVYRKKFVRAAVTPRVSLIIAAYNEEAAIARKLENSLAQDYPPEHLEIIVASDGSTDRTDDIVRSFADRGVKLVRPEHNVGKSEAVNLAVKHASGEILVFSDATGMYDPRSVRAMAAHFADPRVGCVSGWVAYRYDKSVTGEGFSVYQRFVMALRRAEAAFGSGFNAPGSIHAVRATAFMPTPPDTFSDMTDPLHAAVLGLRTTFEEDAVSWEESRTRIEDEFRARVRIASHAWRFMSYSLRRFPLFKSPMYCFQLASHKFLRWLTGPLLIPIFVVNAFLVPHHWIYQVLFAAQLADYGFTALGYLSGRLGRRIKALAGLVFLNTVYLAYIVALIRFLRGDRRISWVPSR